MKQKDFYYSTLYIYDKTLNDALTADFAGSGERSKSKYLADLIALGLTAKKQRAELSDCDKTADIYGKLSLIENTNSYGQAYNIAGFHRTSVPCSLAQIQVIEYIIENEEKNQKMSEIAKRLGISPSAFTKIVNKMTDKKLLEKYRKSDNKKEVIVKASELGHKVYSEYVDSLYNRRFKHTFELLDKVPKEYLDIVSEALNFNAESIADQVNEIHSAKNLSDSDTKPIKITK